ncbi:hypothetical protein BAU15_04965 [Enterococcus sp. JM4C]|nr:hypothetical protein BAU15_04965 [Enterococcus sp. JM4C]
MIHLWFPPRFSFSTVYHYYDKKGSLTTLLSSPLFEISQAPEVASVTPAFFNEPTELAELSSAFRK